MATGRQQCYYTFLFGGGNISPSLLLFLIFAVSEIEADVLRLQISLEF